MERTVRRRPPAIDVPERGSAPVSVARAPQSIWSNDPRFWPKASREYVFLAAAFDEVGKSLFGDAWTGDEKLPPPTPLTDAQRKIAGALTRAPKPPPRVRDGSATTPKIELPKLSDEECAKLRKDLLEALEGERKSGEGIRKRCFETAAWIAEKARDGELVTFGMWIGGGVAPVQLQQSIWNRRDDWQLFATCQVKTYVAPSTVPFDYFLFVKRDSLNRALSPRVGTAKAEKEAERWLRNEFQNPTTASTAKGAFKKRVLERFSGLSGKGFERAWSGATTDFPERSRQGRKPRAA